MKNFLGFLSSRDREILIEKSTAHRFRDGATILRQGEKNSSLYIISEGMVSVVSHIMGHDMEIERLYKDDVLGDLSFVDAEVTSANVIADGDVVVNVVETKDIEDIVRADPMFYGRFYHAIAKVLSKRLREENKKAEEFLRGG